MKSGFDLVVSNVKGSQVVDALYLCTLMHRKYRRVCAVGHEDARAPS